MGLLKNYNPAMVIMTFKNIPITGFADGSFVTVERNEDSFALTVGSDGEGCRAKTNNQSGTITFTLGQWSSSNDLLSAAMIADEVAPLGGLGIGSFLLKDLSGSTLEEADKAWIRKPPASEFSREPTNREWVLETNNLKLFIGGNI